MTPERASERARRCQRPRPGRTGGRSGRPRAILFRTSRRPARAALRSPGRIWRGSGCPARIGDTSYRGASNRWLIRNAVRSGSDRVRSRPSLTGDAQRVKDRRTEGMPRPAGQSMGRGTMAAFGRARMLPGVSSFQEEAHDDEVHGSARGAPRLRCDARAARRRPRAGNHPHRLPHQDLLPDHPRHRGEGEGTLREGRSSSGDHHLPRRRRDLRGDRRQLGRSGAGGGAPGGNADEWSGWILGVKAASPIKAVKELDGKKVGITSAGSGTDTLALWAQSEAKVTFQRVGVGGGGLVPNLLNDNLAAAVIYSPLSYQVVSEGKVRVLQDFATAMP